MLGFATYVPGGVLSLGATLRLADVVPPPIPALPASSLAAELRAALESGDGLDVVLLCGGQELRAHSFVLCVRLPVLRSLLRGPLVVDHSAVPVPDSVQPAVLRRVLQFVYTDELEPASAEEAQHLLAAADHYGLTRLVAICSAFLVAALSVENSAFTLTLADQHGVAALRDAALVFVASNAIMVMRTPGWAHLKASRAELVESVMHTLALGSPPPRRAAAVAGVDDNDDAPPSVRQRVG